MMFRLPAFVIFFALTAACPAALQTRPPGLDPAGLRIAAIEQAIRQADLAITANRLTKGEPNARDLLHQVLASDPFHPQALQSMERLVEALVDHGRNALERETPSLDTAQEYWRYARDLAVAYRLQRANQPLDELLDAIQARQLDEARTPLEQRNQQLAEELDQEKAQRGELQQQLAQRQPVETPKPPPSSPASNRTPSAPAANVAPIQLRAEPADDLAEAEAKKMLADHDFFDSDWHKQGRFKGDLVNNGDGTITDRKTGLIWQQGGSDETKTWQGAKDWIADLNRREGRTGKDKWRLPTLEEAASLLRHQKNDNNLYIDAMFDPKQSYIWTADPKGSAAAWRVYFIFGFVDWNDPVSDYWVRACRASG